MQGLGETLRLVKGWMGDLFGRLRGGAGLVVRGLLGRSVGLRRVGEVMRRCFLVVGGALRGRGDRRSIVAMGF